MRNDTVKRMHVYSIGFRKRESAWTVPDPEDHHYMEDGLTGYR